MRSAQRIRLLAILLVAISTRLLASSAPLRVNESEMSAVISEREIALIAPVSNESETTVSGTLYVDLLDPKDAVVASSKTTEHLKPGRSLIKLSLPRPAIPLVADNDPVLWYRVKYRLLLDDKQAASGVVPSELSPPTCSNSASRTLTKPCLTSPIACEYTQPTRLRGSQ